MHQCCLYYTDKTFCLIRWGHASQEVEGFVTPTYKSNISIKDSPNDQLNHLYYTCQYTQYTNFDNSKGVYITLG